MEYWFSRYSIFDMPWSPKRFTRLRKLKRITQTQLAAAAGVTQTRVSECESGSEPSVAVLERFADRLECTTDFLLGRSFADADAADPDFREAVSRMAYDVFAARASVKDEERGRCRRVVGHNAAPLTSEEWATLAEQIELAIGGPSGGGSQLHSIEGGKGLRGA
jgi:transcriptional regulator with XRE-family HTH domain